MMPNQTSKILKEKLVYSNLQNRRVRQHPNYKLGQLVGTADIKRVFCMGDSTNNSYEVYILVEVKHDTIPSYRINYLPERYNKILLLPTKLTLDENKKVMKQLNLIH